MAANFWTSSHCLNWLKERRDIQRSRARDIAAFQSARNVHRLHLHFLGQIQRLGRFLRLRSRVLSTASVFFKRVYFCTSMVSLDPRLATPTLVFMAAKAEECGVNATKVVQALQELKEDSSTTAVTTEAVLNCEFQCLSLLDFDLTVFHPYRDLVQFTADAGVSDCLQTAWSIVNDSNRTDVCLIYPPYLVAIAAVYMAIVFRGRDCTPWLQSLNANFDEVCEVVRELLDLYDTLDNYSMMGPISALLARLEAFHSAPGGVADDANVAAAGKVLGMPVIPAPGPSPGPGPSAPESARSGAAAPSYSAGAADSGAAAASGKPLANLSAATNHPSGSPTSTSAASLKRSRPGGVAPVPSAAEQSAKRPRPGV